MNQGRSIRLFLVDGTSSGLLTAEIMNWTGHVLTGPRSKLSELVQRPECGRTGVYFLVGPASEQDVRPMVYIGETDDVATRLKQHNKLEEKGGKDFWEKVCLVTSKDENLTKSHVKYIESHLIQIATHLGRCNLVNGTNHSYSSLPESDRSDMSFFIEQVRIVLPAIGLDFLRERPSLISLSTQSKDDELKTSPRFITEVKKLSIKATGQEVEGEFVVLASSLACREWHGSEHSYQYLHQQLCKSGVLIPIDENLCRFSTDYAFSSPSAAAAVVAGRTANGRKEWRLEKTNRQTYADWQDQQVGIAADTAVRATHPLTTENSGCV